MTTTALTTSTEQEEKEMAAFEAALAAEVSVSPRRFDADRLTKADRSVAVAKFQQRVLRALRRRMKVLEERYPGFNIQRLADRLDVDRSLVSRRLKGRDNMSARVMAEMFLALESEPEISASGREELPQAPCPLAPACGIFRKMDGWTAAHPIISLTVIDGGVERHEAFGQWISEGNRIQLNFRCWLKNPVQPDLSLKTEDDVAGMKLTVAQNFELMGFQNFDLTGAQHLPLQSHMAF